MRAYSAFGPTESGSANKTAITVIASASVRPALFDIVVGNSATPADYAAKINVGRFTAAGTSAASAPTPLPVDPSDVAAVATCGHTHSVEPTYTAGGTLLQINLNQRATFRWVAQPGYELKCPATAANGIGTYMASATTAMTQNANVFWFE